jgi:nitrate reductase gamma subunit
MDLLEFARGPALWLSLAILFIGSAWRIVGIFRLKSKTDLSEPRSARLMAGAMGAIIGHMIPKKEFRDTEKIGTFIAYFYHIGLAIIVFGFLPHIYFIKRLTGISWPALPAPVVYLAVAVTFVAMILILMERLTDGVLRLLSNFDDYFSWFVTFLPLVTGMMVINHPFAAGAAPVLPLDPTLLAIHLLSVELLFVWLPFGKLSHAFLVFISRGVTGAAFARKGAAS